MATSFIGVFGTITQITPMRSQCCNSMLTLNTNDGIVNIMVSSDTYVIDQITLRPGMQVAAFYDSMAPVPLIYPPQYHALVIGQMRRQEMISVGFFDRTLTAEDNSLRLNISNRTNITTTNGQRFTCPLGNRVLIVFYTNTTRSIPPQTTPNRVIVFC